MVVAPDAPILDTVSFVALLGGVVVSLVVFHAVSNGRLGERLRSRFVLGVPWGTVIVVLAVWWVYYFVQGAGQFGGPVVVGFRSWSYTYPLGMVVAPFAHGGHGHLVGNLVGTAAFAPVAEYAWSHYPQTAGSQTFTSLRTNPFARILGFVLAVFLVGLATSALIPGALIGFSGVVFAFAGVALVSQPVLGVFALVGSRVIRLLYYSLQNPLVTQSGQTRFVTPGWADIAIQGHLLGLVLGVLVALVLARRRDRWPDASAVWVAVLVFGVAEGLYAVYWYLGGTEYVLYRGVGLALVFALAATVAAAFVATDRRLVPRFDLSRRQVAAGLLVGVVLVIGAIAIPYNTVSVTPGPEMDDGVQVRDYTVTYAEGVQNQYVSAVEVPFVGESASFETSGVIVASENRNAWEVVTPAQRLSVRGVDRVVVGGLGWRDIVYVNRTGWNVVDGGGTYHVKITHEGKTTQVFTAEPATVPSVINDSKITIWPAEQWFELVVSRNESVVGTAPIPPAGTNVTVADITFNRTGKTLVAAHDGTRIRIARLQLRRR